MSRSVENTVATLVPLIYTSSIGEFRYHPNADMSRSTKCHTLTKDLMLALRTEGIESRRELHLIPSKFWHYVIAHGEIDTPPTDEDIITDLNPWTFNGGERFTGYIHAPRAEVMERLQSAGAPEEYIALRSVATIILPHSEDLLTPYTHPPSPIPR